MKIYIAGPMTGYPEFNYPAFRNAEAALVAVGYQVLNPVNSEELNDTGKPQTWLWYMRHALGMVIQAEAIALLPGWEASKGAQLEAHVGRALGLPLEEVNTWVLHAEAERELGAALPVEDKWLVHILGPDDVHETPGGTMAEAIAEAAAINEAMWSKERVDGITEYSPLVWAVPTTEQAMDDLRNAERASRRP